MVVNFNEEKRLWKQGFETVVGLDEVGRGPLAGPVVACAVVIQKYIDNSFQEIKINDSKKLSKKQREYFYHILTNHKNIHWKIGMVSEKVIDKINILEATKLAMKQAVDSLPITADYLLLDGNFILDKVDISQKSIIQGDQKVFSIAAASIIAKVTRDRLMQKMDMQYPEYGFVKHKGYGTKLHIEKLKHFGACPIHRKTFFPVSSLE